MSEMMPYEGSRPVPAPGTVPARQPPPNRPVRRDARVGPPPRHPQWMLNQLPIGMLDSDFFVRFVALFQELGGTLLDSADLVEHVADSTVTPRPLLPHLASWIGVRTVDPSLDETLQRDLVASSARALVWRGTRRGIAEHLRMLSGAEVEVSDSGGVWAQDEAPTGPAWLLMRVQSTGHLSEPEFVELLADEIPAHLHAELWLDDRCIWDTAGVKAPADLREAARL